jgi:hypothetical protein
MAEDIMAMEEDLKYRKKYATVWRKNKASVLGKNSMIASRKCGP